MIDRGAIARAARERGGIVTSEELESLGLSRRSRSRLIAAGELDRLGGGVLAPGSVSPTWEVLCRAALCGLDCALSFGTAGRVHRLTGCADFEEIHVLATLDAHHDLAGVSVHRSGSITAADVTVRAGWRVTTVERTIVDLARVMSRRELSTCIEDAVIARLTTIARIHERFTALAVPGRPGIARLRAVLDELGTNPVLESELERRFRRLLRRARISEPTWQPPLPWARRERGRVDACFETARLVVELDGRTFHARLEAFERDRRRDQDALAAGFRTLRFTDHQLRHDGPRIVDLLRSLLG